MPYVVKPCCEGNSSGISLVTNDDEREAALRLGFSYDDEILVEKYVPLGRELRVSCVEDEDGSIRVLPTIEYFVNKE